MPNAESAGVTGSRTPTLRHGEASIAHGKLHFVECGHGEPLVLIHGGHGSWTHWIANIETLGRHRRVIAPDLPGFGASFNPEPAYDIAQYGASVTALLDALEIRRAAIAGFSFGCVVSAAVARADPERISHVALVNSPGIGPPSPSAAATMRELSELSLRKGLRVGAEASLRRIQLFDQSRIDDALVTLMTNNVRRTRFVSRDLSRIAQTDRLLRDVRQPIMVFIGREDPHRRPGLAEAFKVLTTCAPHVQIQIVEHARHWLQYDRADLFNVRLAEFIG